MVGPKNRGPRPWRSIIAMMLLLLALGGVVGGQLQWLKGAEALPRLGLDLAGGTQIVLKPVQTNGAKLDTNGLEQSRGIIEARINGSGVAEAEITTENNSNIVVSIPGPRLSDQQRNLITRSSQLRFRPVLASALAEPTPLPTTTKTVTPGSKPKPTGKATSDKSTSPIPQSTITDRSSKSSSSSQQRALPPQLLTAVTPSPNDKGGNKGSKPPAKPTPDATPKEITDASDLNQITAAIEQQFTTLDCRDTTKLQGGTDDPKKVLVTCSQDRTEKYILGPVEVDGNDIDTATAGLQTGINGSITNVWEVQLNFKSAGSTKFAEVTTRLTKLPAPRNQFGIVLDGLVISAPSADEPITGGNASITGNFTQTSSFELANQLKYGALPLSFTKETEEQISPLLGKEQLQRGLLAGLIGLILVVLYSLFQYRALGLVTVASLVIAGAFTYAFVVLLGNSSDLRLTLAGITGLIVSIGVTADSFIVYFERVRDEIRDGRSLRSAVETGWKRARRTILAADAINFLAAAVLYSLAAGGVKGFAFTLGLATLIDVIVVMLFTHPSLTLLARTRFFGQGHRLSGLDPQRLGSGAARAIGVKAALGTIASRRAAAATTPQDA